MSKNETPLTRALWKRLGGTLVEEFPVLRKGEHHSGRWIDGVVILNGEHKIASAKDVSLQGKDIVSIQTKTGRLGMYLMGQALFSKHLLEEYHNPKSVRSIALCEKSDKILQPLLEDYGIEVVTIDQKER